MAVKTKSAVQNRALSIRQPFAEWIMSGKKKVEYRGQVTHIRGRVYIYATQSPRMDVLADLKKRNKPDDYDLGVIVGTVEIVACDGEPGAYNWHIANPIRLKRTRKPEGHPQPSWFKPFNK